MEMDVLMSCKQMKMNSSALSMAAKLCLSSKFSVELTMLTMYFIIVRVLKCFFFIKITTATFLLAWIYGDFKGIMVFSNHSCGENITKGFGLVLGYGTQPSLRSLLDHSVPWKKLRSWVAMLSVVSCDPGLGPHVQHQQGVWGMEVSKKACRE